MFQNQKAVLDATVNVFASGHALIQWSKRFDPKERGWKNVGYDSTWAFYQNGGAIYTMLPVVMSVFDAPIAWTSRNFGWFECRTLAGCAQIFTTMALQNVVLNCIYHYFLGPAEFLLPTTESVINYVDVLGCMTSKFFRGLASRSVSISMDGCIRSALVDWNASLATVARELDADTTQELNAQFQYSAETAKEIQRQETTMGSKS